MMLTAHRRTLLTAKQFAVPDKDKLPLEDRAHVEDAWREVDKTKGLTSEERAAAKRRILRRAAELNIDTKDWNR